MNNLSLVTFRDVYERATEYIGPYEHNKTKYIDDIMIYAYAGNTLQIKRNDYGVWISDCNESDQIQLINNGVRCSSFSDGSGMKINNTTVGEFLEICNNHIASGRKILYDPDSITMSKVTTILTDFISLI